MKLTRIEHARGDIVRLFLDGEAEPRLAVPLQVYAEARLSPGDAVSEERLAALAREAELARARDAAVSLLARRPRAREELRRRLRRKEYPDAVIEQVLSWLEEREYLDDDAFAESFVRDRLLLRPRGRSGLLRELRARGVDPGVAESAIDRVLEAQEADEGELARSAADAWARKNPSALRDGRSGDREARLRARRKLYGHLARRGFSSDATHRALDAIFG